MSNHAIELWACLPHPSPAHVVRLFAKDSKGRLYGDFARGPWEIDRFVTEHKEHDVYIAPNPTLRCSGTRHSAADVSHWSFFFLDVDPVEERNDPHLFLAQALDLLEDKVCKRLDQCITLDSGRGTQAWIRLEDWPITNNTAEIGISGKNARKVMGWWLTHLASILGTMYGCRLDTTVSDLPRVMRMPGTVNTKTGKMATFIRTSQWQHEGLAQLLAVGTPDSVFNEPEISVLPVGTPWQMVFTKLTLQAQNYLTKGKEDPGRHTTCWHTARKLQELGIDITQARIALQYANSILGEEMALSPADIEHALKTAYSS
jgi:hypothetical protein